MVKINYKNDVLFKYVLSNAKDKDSRFLLDLIIHEIVGIEYSSLVIRNPDIHPEQLLDKEIILDILLEDSQGRKIDIEMQKSSLSMYLYQRFQFYGAKLLVTQLNEGDTYDQLHAIYQVIFIDDINIAHPCLKEVFTSRSDKGVEEECNLIHRIYIFLPYINEIKKQKPLTQFTRLEKMIYIFANSIDDDILKVEDEVVKVMNRKLEAFTKEESLAYYAMQRQMGHWVQEGEKKEKYQEGLNEGLKEGQKRTLLQLLQHKYPQESFTFFDDCTQKQLDFISLHIFENMTYQEFIESLPEQ